VSNLTTWSKEIARAVARVKDDSLIVFCTLSQAELEVYFDHGYGCPYGEPFTLWTEKRVYFPVQYDGSEWVESVPRYPCDEKTTHVGG
jgi:hypothetical protein